MLNLFSLLSDDAKILETSIKNKFIIHFSSFQDWEFPIFNNKLSTIPLTPPPITKH